MASRHTYFAALPAEDLSAALLERVKRARDRADGLVDVWRAAYAHYYPASGRLGGTSAGLSAAGERGQLVRMQLGQARAQAQALHAFVSNAALSWQAIAANSDASSQSACVLGQRLLEYEWRERGLDAACSRWLEFSLALGAGWAWPEWDETAGEVRSYYESDDGQRRLATYAGDVRLHILAPWDVTVDTAAPSIADCPWRIVTTWRNRYELAEAYGREKDGSAGRRYERLLDVGVDEALRAVVVQGEGEHHVDSDLVPVLHLLHLPTPALPYGRYVASAGDVVLKAGRLDAYYDGMPLVRLATEEQLGTPHGYSRWWDTLGAHEARADLVSAVVSNNQALAVQSVVVPKGTGVTAERLGGMQIIEVPVGSEGNIHGLQLTASSPETYSLIDRLQTEGQETLGLNDVAMGSPERGGSGASYALLAGQAKEQTSPLQRRYVQAVAQLGLAHLRVLRQHVTEERVLAVAGKGARNIYSQSRWSGEGLAGITSVSVEVGNALQQTVAGRSQLADAYAEKGWLPGGPVDYQQVLDTGRLDPTTDPARAEYLAAESDVEALQRGEAPAVHAFHDHPFRARRGAAVLSSEVALQDPAVVQAVYAYVAEHYLEFYGAPMEGDPMRGTRLRELLGQPAPMPVDPMSAPPPGMGGEPPGGPVEGHTGQPDAMGDPTLPGMPTNPLTGQDYDAQTGGGVAELPA